MKGQEERLAGMASPDDSSQEGNSRISLTCRRPEWLDFGEESRNDALIILLSVDLIISFFYWDGPTRQRDLTNSSALEGAAAHPLFGRSPPPCSRRAPLQNET